MNAAKPTSTSGIKRFLMVRSSRLRQLVVNRLQSPSQAQYGVSFSREQRVDAHAGLAGNLLETTAFQLVRHKNIALVFWQFVDRHLEFVDYHLTGVLCVRASLGRRQQILEMQFATFIVSDEAVAEAFRLRPAEEVNDAIASHAK